MALHPLGSLAAFESRSEGFADNGVLEFYKGLLGLSIIIDNTELILMMKGMQWSYIKVKKKSNLAKRKPDAAPKERIGACYTK